MPVYLLFLALFFAVPVLILGVISRRELRRHPRTVLWSMAFVATFGAVWDWLACRTGVWRYDSAATLGVWIDGQKMDFYYATEFIWGGGVPSARKVDWDEITNGPHCPAKKKQPGDIYMIDPIHRPMNKYLDEDVTWSDPTRVINHPTANRVKIPMEWNLPEYFMGPSDSTCAVPMIGASDVVSDADTPASVRNVRCGFPGAPWCIVSAGRQRTGGKEGKA